MTAGVLWSWTVTRDVPDRELVIEGRAGHLAWTFSEVRRRRDQAPRWTIECADVELGSGRTWLSPAVAVAMVVDHVGPFLDPVPVPVAGLPVGGR